MSDRRDTIRRYIRATWGLFIAAFGVMLTINANIGLAPWDTLAMGIAGKTGIPYGTSFVIVSCLVLVFDLLMREQMGFGTFVDAFLFGYMTDFFRWLNICPKQHNVWIGILYMVVGFFIMSYGQYVYMSAGESCGPRDTFIVGLGKFVKKVPIGVVNIVVFSTVTLFGWLLGGKVGVGTLIAAFGAGLEMQFVFHLVKFEPRDVEHDNIIVSVKKLIS